MKAIIDTCVIIDALQSREPFYEDAQKIFLAAANNQFVGYTTANAITDIYYLMHKYTHNIQQSRDVINNLLKIFDLADTYAIDCIQALASPVSDFEDAVLCQIADRNNFDCIVTRNVADFKNADIKFFTPQKFLAELNKDSSF